MQQTSLKVGLLSWDSKEKVTIKDLDFFPGKLTNQVSLYYNSMYLCRPLVEKR